MSQLSAGESGELIQLISGVSHKLDQMVEARLKPTGIAIEQYRVLKALSLRDGLPMGELAAQVFVDSPTLTKIVDRMVANADVYRGPDPHDRRKVLIFISEKGSTRFSGLRPIVEEPQSGLVNRLDRKDADRLRSLLENLLDRN